MFEKKEYIYSETMGVVRVVDVVKLSDKNKRREPVDYYHLRSAFDKSKDAYIPVDNHQVNLRPLISVDEAALMSDEEVEKLSEMRQAEVKFVLEQPVKKEKKAVRE